MLSVVRIERSGSWRVEDVVCRGPQRACVHCPLVVGCISRGPCFFFFAMIHDVSPTYGYGVSIMIGSRGLTKTLPGCSDGTHVSGSMEGSTRRSTLFSTDTSSV